MSTPAATDRSAPSLALILGVLGVVYGDIGTSPLYAMRAAASHFEDGGVEAWEVLGLLSLIIWSLILTVTVKYVAFVLRADNRGEGGILRNSEGERFMERCARGGAGVPCSLACVCWCECGALKTIFGSSNVESIPKRNWYRTDFGKCSFVRF